MLLIPYMQSVQCTLVEVKVYSVLLNLFWEIFSYHNLKIGYLIRRTTAAGFYDIFIKVRNKITMTTNLMLG